MFLLKVCIVLTAESGKLRESNGVWCWLYQYRMEGHAGPSAVTRPAEKHLEPDGARFSIIDRVEFTGGRVRRLPALPHRR
jgi:hypothetical protein